MVLKLYGPAQSSALKVVALILHEKKVSFEIVPIDVSKGEHKLPDHLEKHPFGQVPYMVGPFLPG
jgi:glutathione S-transferase